VIIALAGRAGSGKNTVAKLLGAHEIAFAEPLKRFVQEVFAFTDAQVWGPSEERNKPDMRYPRVDQCPRCFTGDFCEECDGHGMISTFLTPRHALQTLGTEWGRGCYEDVWAELGVRRALACPAPLVAITDCRFVNEAKAVCAAGGEVWRIVRPGAGLAGATGLHPSETEQESPEFLALVTRTVLNGGSLDDLRATLAG
jgi:hypothetical protein